jgi:hypothetical protein
MTAISPDTSSPKTAQSKLAAVLRVTSGNFLEMFDFFLFGSTRPTSPTRSSPQAMNSPRCCSPS